MSMMLVLVDDVDEVDDVMNVWAANHWCGRTRRVGSGIDTKKKLAIDSIIGEILVRYAGDVAPQYTIWINLATSALDLLRANHMASAYDWCHTPHLSNHT